MSLCWLTASDPEPLEISGNKKSPLNQGAYVVVLFGYLQQQQKKSEHFQTKQVKKVYKKLYY